MHAYTIDTDIRKKVILSIFIVSVILSTILTFFLEESIANVKILLQQFDLGYQIFEICDTFGVTVNFVGIPFLYGVVYSLFDNFLWRTKPFKQIFNVPDLRGHWQGTLTSSTYKKTIQMDLYVKQKWSRISFISKFEKSTSTSNVASILINRDGIIKVGFGFINHSRELPHQYDGYNILEIDSDTHLFGRYFNNRDNSNAGFIGGNFGTFDLNKSN